MKRGIGRNRDSLPYFTPNLLKTWEEKRAGTLSSLFFDPEFGFSLV